jgi:hypothetical protein
LRVEAVLTPRSAIGAVVLAAVATGWSLLEPAAAVAGERSRCTTRFTTIAANADVRVYRRGTTRLYSAYACNMRTGRRFSLGSFDGDEDFSAYEFRLRGRFVAYDRMTCVNGTECRAAVRVLDTRLARARRSETLPLRLRRVDGLELSATGAVAWIRERRDLATGTSAVEVRKLDAGGEAILDSAPAIDRGSLAIGGSTAYWLRGGVAQSASLQ